MRIEGIKWKSSGNWPGGTCDRGSPMICKLCCQTAVLIFIREAERGKFPDQLSGFKFIFTGNEKVTGAVVTVPMSTQWDLDSSFHHTVTQTLVPPAPPVCL